MLLFLVLFAAAAIHAQPAELPTAEQLEAIAERFRDAAKSAGMDLPRPLPQVFIRSRPGFSVYHPKENEITFPAWHALTEQKRISLAETGRSLAEPLSGERYFSETFRYFFVHELCHWVQWQERRIDDLSQIDDPYGIEFQANQCAVGFWEAAEPGWMQAVAGRMKAVLDKRSGPMPWGTELRGWFNQRYPGRFGGDYNTAQFRMVLDAWKASPRVTFSGVMEQIDREGTRRFYDARYRDGTRAGLVLKEASPLLVEAIRGRKAGAALDLGLGEGRNSLFLASEKWRVTGVDLSGVAVESARKAAAQRGLDMDLAVSDLDQYDVGEARWDLITSFYMQDWHYRSGLALNSLRGTGYYKVPSLRGVWYRGPFEHQGSVMTLEDWFDPKRLRDDYVPTGSWGPASRRERSKGMSSVCGYPRKTSGR